MLSSSNVNLMILSFSFGTHLFYSVFLVLIDLLLCTNITISLDTDSRVQVLKYCTVKEGKKKECFMLHLTRKHTEEKSSGNIISVFTHMK